MLAPEKEFVGNVGGSNMRFGVATRYGILYDEIVDTPKDPDEIFKTIGSTATRFMKEHPEIKYGSIGWAGPVRITRSGVMVGPFNNIPCLGTEPFEANERVHEESPNLKKKLLFLSLNDAEAETYAAAELIKDDITNQVISYFGIGTGVGGDSIRNGIICSRAAGILAEYGHIPLFMEDGSRTTLEERVSGTAICELYGGGIRTAKELALDPNTDKQWGLVGRDLARGIATLSPVFGHSHVVIGGGVSRDRHRFNGALQEELANAVEPIPRHIVDRPPKIVYVPRHKVDELGLQGAYLGLEQRYKELV